MVQDLAYETVEAIIPFWQMARIKMITRQNCMKLFMKLHDKHRALMKSKGRASDPEGKRSAFVLELDSLFDIGAPDAVQDIESNRLLSMEKKDGDIRFYQDQRTERKGCMLGHDKIFETDPSNKYNIGQRYMVEFIEDPTHLTTLHWDGHHILKVIVGAVWEKLFGKVKSPENPWFRHFKDVWGKLTTDTPKTLMIRSKWLREKKRDCEEILHDILMSEKPPIANYKEMAELTVIVLGGTPPHGIHWSQSGAIHQARWMARNLYSMKMLMFCDQLEYDEETVAKLE
ncbi:hypothetical protein O3P69_001753 [Scylla paramamosain]|uniref:Uncharacterized protein n=1 Tax=Scylla paramamosain TaxID=85552 RepID=A0AAW0UZ83_SCYPA